MNERLKFKPSLLEFSERLQAVIALLKVEKQVFAETGGIRSSTLTAYLNAESQPSQDVLAKWISTYRIDANWLLIGEGEMLRGRTQAAPCATTSDPIAYRLEIVERIMKSNGASESEIREAVMTALRAGEAKQAEGPQPPRRKVGNSEH